MSHGIWEMFSKVLLSSNIIRPERCNHHSKHYCQVKAIYLEGQPEGLVSGPGGGNDSVKGLEEGHAAGLALLPLHVPSLVPGHVLGSLDHVVSVPSRDGDEGNSNRVVSNLLDEVLDLFLDLLKPGLAVGGLGGVHLVASNDELLDTEGVGEEGVLPGLTVLRDSSLELTSAGGDDENSAVSLREDIVLGTVKIKIIFIAVGRNLLDFILI